MIKINIVLIFLVFLTTANCKNQTQSNRLKTIDELISAFNVGVETRNEYEEILIDAKLILSEIDTTNYEQLYPFQSIPNMKFLVENIGPALYPFKNLMLYEAQASGYDEAFLGLAMIQDVRALEPLTRQIIKYSHSPLVKYSFIKLLGLYGEKAKAVLPFLEYLYVNEWHPDTKSLIADIKNKINSNQANTDWARYLLWKELDQKSDKYCSYYPRFEENDTPSDRRKKSTRLTDFTKQDDKLLNKFKLARENVVFLSRVDNDSKLLVKLSGRNGNVYLLSSEEQYEIKDYSNKKWIHDSFVAGDRYFYITSWLHGGNDRSFIEELIWDYNSKTYKFEYRFGLASNFAKVLIKDTEIHIKGSDWEYVINKGTGVIDKGDVCGNKVLINITL